MSHICNDSECIYIGQSSPRNCGCHKTRVQMLETEVTRLQSAAWQTIDSATKDGTEIIGLYFRPADGTFKATIYGPWTVAFERGKWRSSWDNSEVVEYMSDFGTEYKEPDCDPTHWQPLPSCESLA